MTVPAIPIIIITSASTLRRSADGAVRGDTDRAGGKLRFEVDEQAPHLGGGGLDGAVDGIGQAVAHGLAVLRLRSDEPDGVR